MVFYNHNKTITQKGNFMKKIILSAVSLLLASAMITACGGNAASTDSTTEVTAEAAVEEKVGEMRDISSMELVKDMGLGWNLGNTLDVCNADRDGDGNADETAENVDETLWGNPKATQELFDTLKADGITAVRIPVTWRDHLDENNNINAEWMDRVQEVVDYAYNIGMYVIINVHHDGGDDAKFGAWVRSAADDYDTFYARYSAIWNQIAERFRDYSDYLVFESMNEVGFDSLPETKAYELLNKINQDFVDLIRKSGGNNEKRHLLIAGYWTDVEKTCSDKFKMPDDPAGRCIVSVHYYTPWDFCTTNIKNEWGSAAEVKTMERLIGKMNTTFVENGIPVIIGEYAASGNDMASCVFFIEKLNKLCYDYGMATFLWDNGGQVDRTTYQWRTPAFLEAMKRASSGEDYEVVKGE